MISVSTGDLVPPFSPDVLAYEVTSLTTLVPVSVTVTGQDVTIGGAPAKDGVPLDLMVPSLDDATSIAIQAKDAKGAPITYTVRTVPSVRARYKVTTLSAPEPGQIFLTPTQAVGGSGGPTFLYILDETGRLLFYAQTPHPAYDFERRALPNGTVRYTYLMQDGPFDLTTFPFEPSAAYVLDDHFRPLQTIRLAAAGAHPAHAADIHEFVLLDDDHWILEAYAPETVTNVPGYASSNVVSAIVQEVKGGSVVFDWETTSAPTLYQQSTEGNDFANAGGKYADYNHLNSIDVDPGNGNLVVSLRNDDEVVEVDRATGEIVWTLGGAGDDFGLAAADKSSHQHHARFLGPNHLVMFDNGNATKTSRIREYQIDPQAHTAQVLSAVTVDTHYSSAMGSAQKIGGHYFVGWGLRRLTETDVTEIDAATQKKSFELSFADGYTSYRALKF